MSHISIVTPYCHPLLRRERNVQPLYEAVKAVMARFPNYTYEHLFIDNASKDQPVAVLKEPAQRDRNVKIIVNARNFGHIRSPYHGILQASGDAVISLAADFQDPPELIANFLKKWEEGYKLVLGVKEGSQESWLIFWIRSLYYRTISRLADIDLVKQFTGFGLYDRQVVDILKKIDDPYPYFRGLIADIGFESYKVPFHQPGRPRHHQEQLLHAL